MNGSQKQPNKNPALMPADELADCLLLALVVVGASHDELAKLARINVLNVRRLLDERDLLKKQLKLKERSE